jgi:hypothetical protein
MAALIAALQAMVKPDIPVNINKGVPSTAGAALCLPHSTHLLDLIKINYIDIKRKIR